MIKTNRFHVQLTQRVLSDISSIYEGNWFHPTSGTESEADSTEEPGRRRPMGRSVPEKARRALDNVGGCAV